MRIVIQRVCNAKVEVESRVIGEINKGLLLFVGVTKSSTKSKIPTLANKIINLRIFEDENGKFQHSACDIGAEILVISQFTLAANCRKGRRPDFTYSADAKIGRVYYEQMIKELGKSNLKIESGQFGAYMKINAVNDGPVTIILNEEDFN
ncbi:MAG: D-tyrosyl-tRNA(Tyr) deacylase [Bacteriovoracaceae bacterium]|nr:D-tyrosyl-tRNA(Tyr) deacylase [Bacteriovoracaceae bacterium]